MPIVSSFVIDAHAQRDGSRYVIATHVDDTGRVHQMQFAIANKQGESDAESIVTAQAASLGVQLATSETQRTEEAALAEKHATVLYAAVKAGTMSKEEATKLGVDLDARSAR